jgi:hypothetical protein
MADIAQVIATYDALVGVAIGAGLTYGFGALNRRHQEAREDRTRWYEARLQAYTDLQRAVGSGDVLRLRLYPSQEAYDEVTLSLLSALGGSPSYWLSRCSYRSRVSRHGGVGPSR